MEEIWRKIWKTVLFLVASGGFVAAYFSGFDLFQRLFEEGTAPFWVVLIYLMVLITMILVVCLIKIFQTVKKEKYANITDGIHQIEHLCRDFITFAEECKPEEPDSRSMNNYLANLNEILIAILDNVASVYMMLTGTNCRACIKKFYVHNDCIHFFTLARDKKSKSRWGELDFERRSRNHDSLDKNTAFSEIFSANSQKWHFFCNDITKEKSFRFTSKSAYNRFSDDTYQGSFLERLFRPPWHLPYRSTLACAIRQGRLGYSDTREPILVGILAVDSESRGVFNNRWDIQLLFSFADALYHPIRVYGEAEVAADRVGATMRPDGVEA